MNNFFAFLIFIATATVSLGAIGLCIADYVISSLGLYKLAKGNSVKNTWLAWIPGVNCWTVGSIVDVYDRKNGMNRRWRVILPLILCIVIIFAVFYAVFCAEIMEETMGNLYYIGAELWLSFVLMYVGIIFFALSGTVLVACQVVCLFKVFENTVPEKAVKYFLLSLLVPLAEAICLFKCATKSFPQGSEEVIACEEGEISAQCFENHAEVCEQVDDEESISEE